MHSLHRTTDADQKAQIFGWDSALIQNAIGATIVKEVGTSVTAGPVIRQDLAVEVKEVFVKQFPLVDMIEKSESNGLVDAFERQINYTTRTEDQPLTIGETGTVNDDANQYVQDTANIAVFASRRGASLKASFAARATGSIDIAGREVAGGLLKISHDFQTEAFRAQNVTAMGAGPTTNLGLYDATGFKGFRYVTEFMSPSANVVQVDVTSGGGYTVASQAVTNALSLVANNIGDAGGNVDMALGGFQAREYLRQEAYAKTTFFSENSSRVEVQPNLFVQGFTLGGGETVPYMNIPGKSVGSYSINSDGHTYIDIYIADSSTLSIPWLGAPYPTLIEVPLASDGTLRKLTIPYWMVGLEFIAPVYVGKVRLKIA